MTAEYILFQIALYVCAYLAVALATFYSLVRTGMLENRYDEFNRVMASLFWPAAGPVCFVIYLFKKVGELAYYRRDRKKR